MTSPCLHVRTKAAFVFLLLAGFEPRLQLVEATAFRGVAGPGKLVEAGALRGMAERVSAGEVRSVFFEEISSSMSRSNGDVRYVRLEASLRPMFDSLPKTEDGNLGPGVVRYALHRFFVERHGWFVFGLEPQGTLWNNLAPGAVLPNRVPAYMQVLFGEHHAHKESFGLREIAVIAATIEHLVHDEAIWQLRAAYQSNRLSVTSRISTEQTESVVDTYMVGLLYGVDISQSDPEALLLELERLKDDGEGWTETQRWVRDLQQSVNFTTSDRSNPFLLPGSDFNRIANVVEEIGEKYGRWQDLECRSLKDALVELEYQDSGRVLLSDFYTSALSDEGPQHFQFIETISHLRDLGALDESNPAQLSVIIPNYVASRSNCLASSSFFSVCCIDECEALMHRLERQIAAPRVKAEKLASLVAALPSDTVDAPRQLSDGLLRRLEEVAKHHNGEVPLHGRLFAQWLHHAYPRECPYPHEGGVAAPDEYVDLDLQYASEEEMLKQTSVERDAQTDSAYEIPWSPTEELIGVPRAASFFAGFFTHCGTQGVILFLVLASLALHLSDTIKASWAGRVMSKGKGIDRLAKKDCFV